jgi:hypothetical protein
MYVRLFSVSLLYVVVVVLIERNYSKTETWNVADLLTFKAERPVRLCHHRK